ncbi:MAG: lysophospholipid acyltransferase family protein [Coriobacteriia bacterium]|nr:lysophospholipid acyltransferase family protein [Coriobacteriia bacterium]
MLKYEDMWDMSLGGATKDNEVPHWCGNILYVILCAISKTCWRWKVEHRENLRAFKGQGVLVIANHTSFLDVVIMWLANRPAQWTRFMARDTLFDNGGGLLGQIISRVGAFPVSRDTADRTSLKRAARMLKNGETVGIMPEGTRRGKGSKPSEIHAGAAFVAKMGKAPILPMTVRDAEKVKQKGQRLRFPKITVDYGNPVLLSDFDFLPKADRLEGCMWYAMRECFALSQRVPAEEVDMVALFPTGRDFTAVFAEHPIPKHTAQEVAAQFAPKPADAAADKQPAEQDKAE